MRTSFPVLTPEQQLELFSDEPFIAANSEAAVQPVENARLTLDSSVAQRATRTTMAKQRARMMSRESMGAGGRKGACYRQGVEAMRVIRGEQERS